MTKIIVPTGYMGSGSSAVTDFLSEFSNVNVNNGSNEFIFLHCPDGLFDLEDKLILGNNAIRSDEAIYRFKKQMHLLHNSKYFWPGNYKKKISDNFIHYVDEFLVDICSIKMPNTFWYFQEIPVNTKMQIQYFTRRVLRKITNHKLGKRPLLRYKTMEVAFPQKEEFYSAGKIFIEKIVHDVADGKDSVVLDQLLLPHNAYRIDRYFEDTCKVIIVERDPRDVFFLNKYVWSPQGFAVPYPMQVETFCDFYRKMRKNEIQVESNHVLRIQFEDMIYDYNNTASKLCTFLNLDSDSQIHKCKRFDPDISIHNTQLYNKATNCQEEMDYIQRELTEFLYPFPFAVSDQTKNMF